MQTRIHSESGIRNKKFLDYGFRLLVTLIIWSLLVSAAFAGLGAGLGTELGAESQITIEVSKGKLLRLPSPASAVIAADPTIADVQVVSPSLVYVNAKAVGETSVFAVDSQDRELMRATITVTHNLSKLARLVRQQVPGAHVDFQSVDGALVLRGQVDSPLQADDVKRLATSFLKNNQTLVNLLRPLGSDQVMLKVKVAEINRTELKTFGINFQNLSNSGNFLFGLLQGRQVLDPNTGLLARNGSNESLSLQFHTSGHDINGILDALEDSGLVKTLAEPNLTAQSGQTASFLAGGEYPIPVITGTGASAQVSITYKPYGVSLSFTPVVLNKNRISMTVSPEVSSITQTGAVQTAGFNIPAIQTRKASTNVELGSGETFAIAGLLENDLSNDVTKFPFLGDLPVIGALFRSHQFQHSQTELVILVTPYIVKPVREAHRLTDPTQGLKPATDADQVLLGKLNESVPAHGRQSSPGSSPQPSPGPSPEPEKPAQPPLSPATNVSPANISPANISPARQRNPAGYTE